MINAIVCFLCIINAINSISYFLCQTEDKYAEVYGIAKNSLRDLRLMNGGDCEAVLKVIKSHIGKKAMVSPRKSLL